MSKLTLQQFDAENACVSVTEHDTLTEALREHDGWKQAGAVRYMVQGTMSVDCVCKRTMESRNRNIELYIEMPFNNGADKNGDYIEVKAPQACKYLQTVLGAVENAEIMVTVTNDLFRIG